MSKPIKTSWTEEDNERLKAMATKGASAVRAAGALRRSIMAVRRQARKLGAPFPPAGALRKKLAAAAKDAQR